MSHQTKKNSKKPKKRKNHSKKAVHDTSHKTQPLANVQSTNAPIKSEPHTAQTPRTTQTPQTPRTTQTPQTPRTAHTAHTPRTAHTAHTPRTAHTAQTPRTAHTAQTPRTALKPTKARDVQQVDIQLKLPTLKMPKLKIPNLAELTGFGKPNPIENQARTMNDLQETSEEALNLAVEKTADSIRNSSKALAIVSQDPNVQKELGVTIEIVGDAIAAVASNSGRIAAKIAEKMAEPLRQYIIAGSEMINNTTFDLIMGAVGMWPILGDTLATAGQILKTGNKSASRTLFSSFRAMSDIADIKNQEAANALATADIYRETNQQMQKFTNSINNVAEAVRLDEAEKKYAKQKAKYELKVGTEIKNITAATEKVKEAAAKGVKNAAAGVEKATADVKKATADVKNATTDVKKATTDVKKAATADVKNAKTDVKNAKTDVKNAKTDVKKATGVKGPTKVTSKAAKAPAKAPAKTTKAPKAVKAPAKTAKAPKAAKAPSGGGKSSSKHHLKKGTKKKARKRKHKTRRHRNKRKNKTKKRARKRKHKTRRH